MARIAVPVFLIASVFALTAHAETGTIRICRTPGITSNTDHKPISIPVGTNFVTSPDAMDSEGRYKSIGVKTTTSAQIAATEKCSVASAKLIENQTGKKVTPSAFRLRFSGSGDFPEVTAYVASNFE
jgi:hypothetical protein